MSEGALQLLRAGTRRLVVLRRARRVRGIGGVVMAGGFAEPHARPQRSPREQPTRSTGSGSSSSGSASNFAVRGKVLQLAEASRQVLAACGWGGHPPAVGGSQLLTAMVRQLSLAVSGSTLYLFARA